MTSRAARFERFGEPAQVLSVAAGPAPTPGPGELRLRLTHRPINPSDLATIRGVYGWLPTLPATPGFEAVGVVDAVGDGVDAWSVGERAVPMGAAGTWCDHLLVSADSAVRPHAGLADEAAAQLVVNPVTAWVMVQQVLGLMPGDTLLQTAAGSTLGRMILQLAPRWGLKTVNFVRRAEQIAELEALGADCVLCTDDPDLVAKARAAAGGEGATAAIDAVGGRTGARAASSVQRGATMLVYGLLSGRPMPLNAGEMIFREITVQGFWLSRWFRRTPPGQVAEVLDQLMSAMVTGDLTPPVEASYPLDDVVTAVAHAERPGRSGKVLLVG